jgi:hypothetical protein
MQERGEGPGRIRDRRGKTGRNDRKGYPLQYPAILEGLTLILIAATAARSSKIR